MKLRDETSSMKREYPSNVPFLEILNKKFIEEEEKGNRVKEIRINWVDYAQVRYCYSDQYKNGFKSNDAMPKITPSYNPDLIFGTIWGADIKIGRGFPESKIEIKSEKIESEVRNV